MKTLIYTTLLTFSLTASTFGAAIGTITSNGRFEVEGATIWNQGTLIEGARVATGPAASRLQLNGGSDIRLGVASRARVYADRLLLESGSVQGRLPANFRMETSALGLRIEGEGAQADSAQAQIQLSENGKVLVASLEGSLAVRNPQGLLLARLVEGNAVELSGTQNGGTASTKLTGVVKHQAGKYVITDEVTGVTAELRGDQVAKFAGKRIVASGELSAGATPAAGAEYVVLVQSIEMPAGAAAAAHGAATVGKLTGMSTATKIGIVGGVVVAGGVSAGVVASGEDKQDPVSPQPK